MIFHIKTIYILIKYKKKKQKQILCTCYTFFKTYLIDIVFMWERETQLNRTITVIYGRQRLKDFKVWLF